MSCFNDTRSLSIGDYASSGTYFNPCHPDPGRREKINLFLFSHIFFKPQKVIWKPCGASKGFMKALIKPFDAPQESEKIKM